MEKVENGLKERNREFYTYKENGTKFIAYKEADEELVDWLIRSDSRPSSPPFKHEGYCIDNEADSEKLLEALNSKNIPSVTRNSEGFICTFWPEEYSSEVAAFDETFRHLREYQE